MITRLTIGNFQGFGPKESVPLSNVTLIFGPNSSGKSSVLRALRLMAQSFQREYEQGEQAGFEFSGEVIDLGSFENAVNGQDANKNIRLGIHLSETGQILQITGIEWLIDSDSLPHTTWIYGRYATDETKSEFVDFSLCLERDSNSEAGSNKWKLSKTSRVAYNRVHRVASTYVKMLDQSAKTEAKMAPIMRGLFSPSVKFGELKIDIDETPPTVEIWQQRLLGKARNSENVRFSSHRLVPTEENHTQSSAVGGLAPSIESALNNFYMRLKTSLEKLHYVEPLRPVPGKLVGSLGYATSDEVNLANELSQNESMRQSVSKYLTELTNGIYELEWWPVLHEKKQAFKHLPHLGALLIHDKNNDTRVTFSDVGVGLSQLLPILAKLVALEISAPKRKIGQFKTSGTLLAEQPELHLHPRMQSELAEFFSRITSKNDGSVQIIAETHSESMLLRLQSLIRAEKLKSKNIQILYTQRDKRQKSNTIKAIPLDGSGEFIEPWPESFSELRFQEFL